MYHYDDFSNSIEIVNHDCIDFVFYMSDNNLQVLSLIEQNDEFSLQLSNILPVDQPILHLNKAEDI